RRTGAGDAGQRAARAGRIRRLRRALRRRVHVDRRFALDTAAGRDGRHGGRVRRAVPGMAGLPPRCRLDPADPPSPRRSPEATMNPATRPRTDDVRETRGSTDGIERRATSHLVLSAHDYRTPRRANIHFIAAELARRGP